MVMKKLDAIPAFTPMGSGHPWGDHVNFFQKSPSLPQGSKGEDSVLCSNSESTDLKHFLFLNTKKIPSAKMTISSASSQKPLI